MTSFFSGTRKEREERKKAKMQEAVGGTPKDYKPVYDSTLDDGPRFAGTKLDRNSKHIPLTSIITKEQIRKEFDEDSLNELAASIETSKQQQAAIVYWSEEDNAYVIIAGERRFRAAQRANGVDTLLCRVHDGKPNAEEILEIQFIENAQRKNLNPLEEALAYKKFTDEFGYTTTKIAEKTGKNQSTISRALSLLKLPKEIQQDIEKGAMPVSVGREIAKVKNETEQLAMAEQYRSGNLTTAKAQEKTNKKAKAKIKASSSSKSKRWTVDGIGISVSIPNGSSMKDVADALLRKHEEIMADKRVSKAA